MRDKFESFDGEHKDKDLEGEYQSKHDHQEETVEKDITTGNSVSGYSKPETSFLKVLLKTMFIATTLSASAYTFYSAYMQSLQEESVVEQVAYVELSEFNKLSLELERVTGQLTELSIRENFRVYTQKDIELSDRLDHFEVFTDSFDETTESIDLVSSRVEYLESEMANTDYVSKSDFADLKRSVFNLSKESDALRFEFDNFDVSLLASSSDDLPVNEDEVMVDSPENKSTVKESVDIKTLGHLSLLEIKKVSNGYLAVFSDGLSGAIQLMPGDFVSDYQVIDITAESVICVNLLTGKEFNVVIK
ncbi:hypothetical protein [Vibrio barjaei]|uniref:hypothetical protein n=1 Tax=Vibrio barjaei TaxID=1676683 RepID=UPI002284CD3D|nr:hypothetical protein [Vibrio barjaei]MCY9874541.1 hypothetical protein [Vibrio barjaei]